MYNFLWQRHKNSFANILADIPRTLFNYSSVFSLGHYYSILNRYINVSLSTKFDKSFILIGRQEKELSYWSIKNINKTLTNDIATL